MATIEWTRDLIDENIDLERIGHNGLTAFQWECAFGHDDIVSRLIEAGTDVNKRTQAGTPTICLATGRGQQTIVARLISAGAQLDDQDHLGRTALRTACR